MEGNVGESLDRLFEKLTTLNPGWERAAVLEVVYIAIEQLYKAVMDPAKKTVTWDNLACRLSLPVECDWEKNPPLVELGEIEGEDLKDQKRFIALGNSTKWIEIYEQGGKKTYRVPGHLAEKINALPVENRANAAIKEGLYTWETRRATRQEHAVEAKAKIAILPLYMDLDKQEAFFPVQAEVEIIGLPRRKDRNKVAGSFFPAFLKDLAQMIETALEATAPEIKTAMIRGGMTTTPRFKRKNVPDGRLTSNALNEAIEELLPASSPPASVTEISLPYEADHGRGSVNRAYVLDGEDRISIEAKALQYFSESGYTGFYAENRFWEHFSSFLFYEAMLVRTGMSSYGLPWPIVNPDPECIDVSLYIEEFNAIKRVPDLKGLVHDYVNHYLGLQVSCEVEEKRRSSQRFKNSLAWFDALIDNVDRNTLLRVVDWAIRSPGGQVKGMPDLILFRNHRISFAEVKSETDRLSKSQEITLDFLSLKLGFEVFLVIGVMGP